MKYKVLYEYHAMVTVEVDADNEKDAVIAGMEEASEGIDGAATLYDTTVRPIV